MRILYLTPQEVAMIKRLILEHPESSAILRDILKEIERGETKP